jgi:hypothetical protein
MIMSSRPLFEVFADYCSENSRLSGSTTATYDESLNANKPQKLPVQWSALLLKVVLGVQGAANSTALQLGGRLHDLAILVDRCKRQNRVDSVSLVSIFESFKLVLISREAAQDKQFRLLEDAFYQLHPSLAAVRGRPPVGAVVAPSGSGSSRGGSGGGSMKHIGKARAGASKSKGMTLGPQKGRAQSRRPAATGIATAGGGSGGGGATLSKRERAAPKKRKRNNSSKKWMVDGEGEDDVDMDASDDEDLFDSASEDENRPHLGNGLNRKGLTDQGRAKRVRAERTYAEADEEEEEEEDDEEEDDDDGIGGGGGGGGGGGYAAQARRDDEEDKYPHKGVAIPDAVMKPLCVEICSQLCEVDFEGIFNMEVSFAKSVVLMII